MSTYDYGIYKIGTEGWQFNDSNRPNNVLDYARDFELAVIRTMFPGLGVIPTVIAGAVAGDGAWCPTYGLWAGPGWAGGVRYPSEENGRINWTTKPCFNENVKTSATPESCYSVVDAITKFHDWEYTLAEDKKAANIYNDAQYKEALLAADVKMLQNIENAVKNGFYDSPTWVQNPSDLTWTVDNANPTRYTNTLDQTEKTYLAKLVPAFLLKISFQDESGLFKAAAMTAISGIKTKIDIQCEFLVSSDSSVKNILEQKDNILIMQQERATNINAWIMNLNDKNPSSKPVSVNIEYGAGSTKAEDTFVIGEGGLIRINAGTGADEIKIRRAQSDTNTSYTFEIAGGSGKDTYKLDSSFSYKLIDSGDNEIYITGDNGDWLRVDNLFKVIDGTWESEDGSIKLVGKTITLANGNTITLSDNFQSGDFGINLKPTPSNPETTNPILGDQNPYNLNDSMLFDTTANDKIMSGAGDDDIWTVYGGDDWILCGDGADIVGDHQGPFERQILKNSIIEGGSGSDILFGSYTVSNQLFADSYGEMKTLIAAGEIAEGTNERGDFIIGGEDQSEDSIYGSDGSDILMNGLGKGLIVGGGGNDLIYGDFKGQASATSESLSTWGYTITMGENNTYTPAITGVSVTFNTPEGAGNDDVIYAGTGNDFVISGGGGDEIYGGTGSDTLFGDAGSDFIEGGDGNDTLSGGDGDDYLDGEAGQNKLYGDAGNDIMFGGDENDHMEGDNKDQAQGNDYLDGLGGNDTIVGAGGADTLYGGDGDDFLHGDGSNVAEADQAADYIDGEAGNDAINGYGGDDTLYGSDGHDTIMGGAGDDYINGEEGDNNLYGDAGNDEIRAGSGADQIDTGTGDNYVDAGDGNNIVVAGTGHDIIFAGSGDDQIQGAKTYLHDYFELQLAA